jgi:hypothetical protein
LQLKGWRKAKKIALIEKMNPTWLRTWGGNAVPGPIDEEKGLGSLVETP